MGEPAVDNDYLYCGSRDNKVYALDRRTGKIIWQKDMGSQVLAGLRLVPICPDWQAVLDDSIPGISAPTRSLFAVATGGRLACLDPQSGKIAWEYELGKDTGMQRELISRPAVIVRRDQNAERRRIFLCGELRDSVVGTVARCVCLEDIVVLGDR
ncbi:MAG: hypothetical protein KatS3mg105_0742 [Gemmatales bacterium]|nr:MAG: hypothetical protein KatS3mg105_0742 [Gemmatales bacterium]